MSRFHHSLLIQKSIHDNPTQVLTSDNSDLIESDRIYVLQVMLDHFPIYLHVLEILIIHKFSEVGAPLIHDTVLFVGHAELVHFPQLCIVVAEMSRIGEPVFK